MLLRKPICRPPPFNTAGPSKQRFGPPCRTLMRRAASSASKKSACLDVANPEGAPFRLELEAGTAAADVYQVSLKKPLGLTLTEISGSILVDEVVPNGHAAQAGVTAGDVLLATTAKAQVTSAAPGVTHTVLLPTAGQSFKTVAAALRSNTCSQCLITLVLQRQ